MVSAARLSLLSCATCVRQTWPACDHPASQTSDTGEKASQLVANHANNSRPTYSSVPVRGLGLQTQQPQQLDDVAIGATYGTWFLLLVSSMKHESVNSHTHMIDNRAPHCPTHTQKLHNLVKAQKRYRLSQATQNRLN